MIEQHQKAERRSIHFSGFLPETDKGSECRKKKIGESCSVKNWKVQEVQ